MIIIVIGLPGTGKTTFSRALAEKIGAINLNTDIIRDRLQLRGQYDRNTKRIIYENMQLEAARAVRQNKHVVVDGTFYKQRLRDSYQVFASKNRVGLKWIELKAKEATIKSRVDKKRTYSEADYEVYLKVKALFEPMKKDCLNLWTDGEADLKKLLRKAVQHLGLASNGENWISTNDYQRN